MNKSCHKTTPREGTWPTISESPASPLTERHCSYFDIGSGIRQLIGLLCCWALTTPLLATAAPPWRVLILSGQNNHAWQETTPKLKAILTAGERFVVDVTEHPEQSTAEMFAKYDVILSNWNTFGSKAAVKEWPESTRQAFLQFIRGGKGLVVIHAGGSSFYDWPDYQQVVGASWKTGQTSHGKPHAFTVNFTATKQSITEGLEPFTTTDELWIRPGVPPDAKVLATAEEQPLALITRYGQGRGFTLLLGHSAAFMATHGFQELLLRGTEWAATGTVTPTRKTP